MTPKQILDSFSETLMQDERILSAQERALLRNLLHHARSASLEPETHAAVNATIASAVGETVAQRAFAVLGGSIVERILKGSEADSISLARGHSATFSAGDLSTPGQPLPPQPSPTEPPDLPMPGEKPNPPSPGPPGLSETKRPMSRKTSLLERPNVVASECIVLNEFLAPQEMRDITAFTLSNETDFSASTVVGQELREGAVYQEHRRSRVLMNLGKYQDLILDRIQSVFPLVLDRLGMEEFHITHAETQITASNDGDFFRCHLDNGDAETASRLFTFVYFFHREPRQFRGGELRIYHPHRDVSWGATADAYTRIAPQQNQIVFFPCSALHEITPVECPSGLFADSRFTLNGWLHG